MAYGPVNVGSVSSSGGAGYEEVQETASKALEKAEAAATSAQEARNAADTALTAANALKEVLEQGGGTGGEITLSFYSIGDTPPENTKLLWIDTAEETGGLKYFNGTDWTAVPVVWG